MRRALWVLAAIAAWIPVAASSQPAGPEAKSWYLERGRANMQIKNYRAAAPAARRPPKGDAAGRADAGADGGVAAAAALASS